ncbi:MAG: hypothetical protein EP335_17155 [Alphaproteobacteria bacterium]|nr:MAG: hypothetical protein EP335_17155 [Alphaproteobacteria bacterium]
MNKLAALHMRLGVIYAIIGMTLGNFMGASHDFTLMPVHAHINLVGFVSVMLYGLVYMAFRDQPVTRLMKAHAGLAHVSVLGMCASLSVMFLTGQAEPVVGIFSVLTLLSMVLFAVILFGLTKKA